MSEKTVEVKDKDWEKIKKEIEKLKDNYVTVGVHEDAGAYVTKEQTKGMKKKQAASARNSLGAFGGGAGISLAQLAAVHEYGTDITNGFGKGIHIHIPSRSWMRGWLDTHKHEIDEFIEKLVHKVEIGAITPDRALGLLGEYAVGGMKKGIKEHIAPPLKPQTVANKRSSTPLIDTGQFWNSINYKRVTGAGE